MGITGDATQDAASKDFKTGDAIARAHAVHIWLYVVGTTLPTGLSKTDDPRWDAAVAAGYAGKANTIAHLANTWAADADYATKIVARLNAMQAAGLLTTITPPSQASGGTTVPTTPTPTTYAPPKLLKLFGDADAAKLPMTRDKNGVYFNIEDTTITAKVATAAYQWADTKHAPKTADIKAGETRVASWAWTDPQGNVWLYDAKGERLVGKYWDGVLTVPDTNPGGVITDGGSAAITDYAHVTVANYRTIKDPSILLPPLVWKGSTNFFPNRHGLGKAVAIVYHCTDDLVLANTISWFQNPSSNASSNFVIDRDGTVYQFVSSVDAPWTNGDYEVNGESGYRTDIDWLVKAIESGNNVNDYTISYEFVATPDTPPTEAQYQVAIRLSRYFCHPKVLGIDANRSHQLRHADINRISRGYCPGPNFDLARIITALGGDPNQISA